MATNSPSLTLRVTSTSTSVRAFSVPNDLLTPARLSSGIGHLQGADAILSQARDGSADEARDIEDQRQVPLHQAHDPIEQKADQADGQDGEDDVLADAGVV